MSNEYSNLMNRMGELLLEVQDFKNETINHENEVRKNIEINSDFLVRQKELLSKMKSEINLHNMEYRTNLEEVTKYIQNTIVSDMDKHINKKIEEIEKIIRPMESRVKQFQDAVNDIEKVVNQSMFKLGNIIQKSDEAFKKHTNTLDRFSNDLANRDSFADVIVTDKETIKETIEMNLNEKFQRIIEMLENNVLK